MTTPPSISRVRRSARAGLLAAPAALALLLLLAGCDVGTNPLIIDGSVASANFPVNAEIPSFLPPAFSVEDSVDLSGIYDGADGVDSIKFYNLTFISEGDSAHLGLRLTGSIDVAGVPFLVFNDVPLTDFTPERSIFNPTPGFSYDARGVARIRQALAPRSTDRGLRMTGTFQANGRSLHFTMQAKLYTQVFLRSVN
jgi:hypothetical protein